MWVDNLWCGLGKEEGEFKPNVRKAGGRGEFLFSYLDPKQEANFLCFLFGCVLIISSHRHVMFGCVLIIVSQRQFTSPTTNFNFSN
jgi:hypothetical protein